MSRKGDLQITIAVGCLVFGVTAMTLIFIAAATDTMGDGVTAIVISLLGISALTIGAMLLTSGILARKSPNDK